jgi:hypothetical protein
LDRHCRRSIPTQLVGQFSPKLHVSAGFTHDGACGTDRLDGHSRVIVFKCFRENLLRLVVESLDPSLAGPNILQEGGGTHQFPSIFVSRDGLGYMGPMPLDVRFRCPEMARYVPQRCPGNDSSLDFEPLRVFADGAGPRHLILILPPIATNVKTLICAK